MLAKLAIGVVRTNLVTQGALVSMGVNLVQNRNVTKQNIGCFVVGDGSHYIPTNTMVNWDPDRNDQISIDANNVTGGQI